MTLHIATPFSSSPVSSNCLYHRHWTSYNSDQSGGGTLDLGENHCVTGVPLLDPMPFECGEESWLNGAGGSSQSQVHVPVLDEEDDDPVGPDYLPGHIASINLRLTEIHNEDETDGMDSAAEVAQEVLDMERMLANAGTDSLKEDWGFINALKNANLDDSGLDTECIE